MATQATIARCPAEAVARTGDRVLRETRGVLRVKDVLTGGYAVLEPGVVLQDCRIHRNNQPGCDAYVVEFQSAGREYSCPLFRFQARTQTVNLDATQVLPVDVAV